MSHTGKRLDDDEARGLKWRLEVLEARREESDRFAWAVPGLVIAAQAFLLSVALNPNTQPFGRLVASFAGFVTVVATAHLMAKQVHHFDVYETSYRKRRWWEGWRRRLIVNRKAVEVWAWTLMLIAALDLGLFVYSIFA